MMHYSTIWNLIVFELHHISCCESLPPVLWGKERMGGKVMIINTIARARNLRKRMTDAEIKLWQALRLRYRVQRFWNNEVLLHFDTVLEKIWDICNPTPHPFLPPQNGGKGLRAADHAAL